MTRFIELLMLGLLLTATVNCAPARQSAADHQPVYNQSQGTKRTGLVSDPVFGGKVYIETTGDPGKPAVVLVHGLGNEASTSWQSTQDLLKKDFYVFTLDLPGFGRSSKANVLYSPENYARLINQLARRHVRKSFHLVGHSMGGAIALQYAASYPNDVKTLTLVDAAGILHRLAYSKYLAPLGIDTVLNQYNVFDENTVSDLAGAIMSTLEASMPVDLNALVEKPLFRQTVLGGSPTPIAGLSLVLNDYSNVPEKIKAATLIIWGDQDKIAPLRTGYVLDALIPKSTLQLIAGGDHMAFLNRPRDFHHLLLQQIKPDNSTDLWRESLLPKAEFRQSVQCKNNDNNVITGNIGQLNIDNCQDVVVQNASINKVMIGGSRVTFINVNVKGKGAALTAHQSSIEITAGSINGDVAIVAYDSRLDIAGTRLIGREAAMKAPVESNAIFSLGRINSPLYKGNVIHGQKTIGPGTPL